MKNTLLITTFITLLLVDGTAGLLVNFWLI